MKYEDAEQKISGETITNKLYDVICLLCSVTEGLLPGDNHDAVSHLRVIRHALQGIYKEAELSKDPCISQYAKVMEEMKQTEALERIKF